MKLISGNPSFLLLSMVLLACGPSGDTDQTIVEEGTYAHDLAFPREHIDGIVELADETGDARIALSARYQGRVMTSAATGTSGDSYGWINYDLISSGKVLQQFNPVGGEERLWIGPEGGQFSFYFAPGDSFEISN